MCNKDDDLALWLANVPIPPVDEDDEDEEPLHDDCEYCGTEIE